MKLENKIDYTKLRARFREKLKNISSNDIRKWVDKDYYRTQIQNEPLLPVNFNRSLEGNTSLTEFKKYKKYSGRGCDVVLPWGETLKEFHDKMNPNEEIYFYIDQERGYSEYVMVEDDVRFKHPETGEWVEAVFYENETGKYIREKKDFYNKFKEVEKDY